MNSPSRESFNCSNSIPFIPPVSCAISSTVSSSIRCTDCLFCQSQSTICVIITGSSSCKSGDIISSKSDGISCCIGVSIVSSAVSTSETTRSTNAVPASECSTVARASASSSAVQLKYCPIVQFSICASNSNSTVSRCNCRTLANAASFNCSPYNACSSVIQCVLRCARLFAIVRHSSASPKVSTVLLPFSILQLCQMRSARCSSASVSSKSCSKVSASLVHCASVNISSAGKYFFR